MFLIYICVENLKQSAYLKMKTNWAQDQLVAANWIYWQENKSTDEGSWNQDVTARHEESQQSDNMSSYSVLALTWLVSTSSINSYK